MQSKYGEALNFWIDVAQPTRVLKQSVKNDWVVSKYDEATPRDPIPIKVTAMNSYQNGSFEMGTRFVRSNAQFNVTIDPATFTLAGLGMPVGTSVIDMRIHRELDTGRGQVWRNFQLASELNPKPRLTWLTSRTCSNTMGRRRRDYKPPHGFCSTRPTDLKLRRRRR